jgi:hypothetical protein
MKSGNDERLLLPACGEKVGMRGPFGSAQNRGGRPLTRIASQSDLSPHAGRGERLRIKRAACFSPGCSNFDSFRQEDTNLFRGCFALIGCALGRLDRDGFLTEPFLAHGFADQGTDSRGMRTASDRDQITLRQNSGSTTGRATTPGCFTAFSGIKANPRPAATMPRSNRRARPNRSGCRSPPFT